jgi:outer membrane receptor protein involved in Fe transport
MIRVASGGFAGAASHANLGRARIAGFDLEVKGDVTPWLFAQVAMTLQDARDTQRLTPGTQVANPTRGLRLPHLPWLFGSSLVEVHGDDLFGPGQRTRFFHETVFTEEYFYAFEMSRNQERRIPRSLTHTVGAEQQWMLPGLTLSAEIQNLFDARALNQFNFPLPGRTFRVKLRYTRMLDQAEPGFTAQPGDGR